MVSLSKVGKVTIQVSGDSSIYRQAERAVVFIAIGSEGSSQEAVSQEVTSTSSKLRATLVELAEKTQSGKPLRPDCPTAIPTLNTHHLQANPPPPHPSHTGQ
jgi:Protein of unknown function (DUF541)